MNIPTNNHTHQPAINRSASAFDHAHGSESGASIAAIYVKGAKQGASKTPVTAWASELTFDIFINSAGGGPSSKAEGVGFAPEDNVPGDDEYKVMVQHGAKVVVHSTGKFDSFSIPWRPKTAPCPAAPKPPGGFTLNPDGTVKVIIPNTGGEGLDGSGSSSGSGGNTGSAGSSSSEVQH